MKTSSEERPYSCGKCGLDIGNVPVSETVSCEVCNKDFCSDACRNLHEAKCKSENPEEWA